MRRRLPALACAIASLSLALAAPAAAAPSPSGGDAGSGSPAFHILSRAVLAAIGGVGAGHAMDTLGNSLALLGARYEIEHRERAAAHAAAKAPAPKPVPAPAPAEEEVDPAHMPAASAGTNGTVVPHLGSPDTRIVARSRGAESNAILLSGIALAPPDAPDAVKNVINAANTIVGRPYIWGGGHASFYSNGYDCSGSVSFALFGGGLIPRPLTSGELEGWGAPGPGKWITVYASANHTFAEIAGLRWDTVGDARGTGPRWHLPIASPSGFLVRHPPGL